MDLVLSSYLYHPPPWNLDLLDFLLQKPEPPLEGVGLRVDVLKLHHPKLPKLRDIAVGALEDELTKRNLQE